MEKRPGFLTFYWDAKKGKIWLEISRFNQELLYYPTLAQGVGSNDIGLDRGRLGQEHVVQFQRSGNRVLLIETNYGYRALSLDSLERRAVAESFAQSVHGGFEIVAEENGTVLVDFTPFLLQDAVGAIQAIAQTRQGTFRIDPNRCALYLPHTKAFPQNTEFEATITLTGDAPGPYLREVVPTPTIVTMRQHHSFVQLPDLTAPDAYKPRIMDSRSGYFGIDFFDYASPFSQPISKRYIARHKLQKKDPSAAISDPVEPIVYYMDPGAPEPIRSALMDGAKWWNQAFEAAGYRNAFQVKLLPPDADPMDVRYNLVQWVHRSTRGWSYGASITDPRTGQILKGKVTLGSLRVRQDYLIAQGLVGSFDTNGADTTEAVQMALARLRQLAAHEIGHTLGLPHNYAASVNSRASVMDYPHPQVDIVDNAGNPKLSLANAYTTEIGEWDKVAIAYGYQHFPKGANEKAELDKIITNYIRRGLKYLSDQDGRPEGGAHPQTHLWDNGTDAVAELNRVMQIRHIALNQFNEKKIPVGTPMANLEEVLVPLYMFHRYQVEAAVKVLGGLDYTYATRGDGQLVTQVVPAQTQRQALSSLMNTILPTNLVLPEPILKLIPPRAYGFNANPREVFKRRTGITFDPLGPPEAAINLTLRLLLNPERCARLINQQALDPQQPGMSELVSALMGQAFGMRLTGQYNHSDQIQLLLRHKLVEGLIGLATNKDTDARVREVAHNGLMAIKKKYLRGRSTEVEYKTELQYRTSNRNPGYLHWMIRQYEQNPQQAPVATTALVAPDGAPIDPGQEWLDGCSWH
ncbi:DUF5117 domain-containing protein [Rudanella paleaurantiibacter]|uniref:DUF5117 domain-containing protein n=2 Tax=Rudanella paleaurantiibacter TaxID=2614655 RepID=A0A7J5TZT0_9BACT|nr:zinc-dependent metalloprotease [Rudanella paleaurantiibacter]KAB7729396.1 DUF5117 domain-containing protein [Rudanella paleaurantiibacter]